MHASRILNKNVAYYPSSLAVIDGDRKLTYRELDDRVCRLVTVLRNRGMEKGDRIAVLAYNCQEYLECMHACERAGFVCVPLNFRLDPDTLAYILNHSGSRAILIQDNFLPVVSEIRSSVTTLEYILSFGSRQQLPEKVESYDGVLESAVPAKLTTEIVDSDLAYIIYSSGTTGRPKGIMYNHRMQFEGAKTFINELRLSKSDVSAIVMPLFHAGGHTMASAISYVGGTNVMMEKFEAEKMLQIISTEKVTAIHIVPTMIASLLESKNIRDYDLSSLKTIFYAASPIALPLLKKAMTVFGEDRFIQGYGLTENGPSISRLSREEHIKASQAQASSMEIKRLESVGLPHFNTEVRIVGPDGEERGPGIVGEIVTRSESTTMGYWQQPELTISKIKDGWLYTGDMGTIDQDGYLYIVDRKDDMIISGGENIYPNEVETVLAGHPAVKEAAVIGIPDEKWGEVVGAVVSLWQGAEVTEEELYQFCRDRLAGYKMPRKIIKMEVLPKTASGKIFRRMIKQTLLN